MKCDICKKKIPETFMSKIVGTYVKDKKGKKHPVCSGCQQKLKTKDDLLEKI